MCKCNNMVRYYNAMQLKGKTLMQLLKNIGNWIRTTVQELDDVFCDTFLRHNLPLALQQAMYVYLLSLIGIYILVYRKRLSKS